MMPRSQQGSERKDTRRLAHLLRRWADARRLDASQSAAIRQAVLTDVADLGFDWWWRLLNPEQGTATRAWTIPVEHATSQWKPPDPSVWPTAGYSQAADPAHDDSTPYLPYLRLI
jgi:hypothetical protein